MSDLQPGDHEVRIGAVTLVLRQLQHEVWQVLLDTRYIGQLSRAFPASSGARFQYIARVAGWENFPDGFISVDWQESLRLLLEYSP